MKPNYLAILMAWVLFSCAPLQKMQDPPLNAPNIGVIGKTEKSLLDSDFQQIGQPRLSQCIALSVQEIPFSKATFKKYKTLKVQSGQQLAVTYNDSLPEKPKYLRLEIQDKIGLTTLLNDSKNEAVRSYLEKDKDCRIVSSISLYMPAMEADDLVGTPELFLGSNHNGSLHIELVNGKERRILALAENDIFDYALMGFCWGEDIYGNARIETLNDKGGCPNGTEKSAQKLEDHKSYLKL